VHAKWNFHLCRVAWSAQQRRARTAKPPQNAARSAGSQAALRTQSSA
jgi:hypothetical protein